MRSLRLLSLSAIALISAACGRSGSGARNVEAGSFRAIGIGANVDPTIHPARLLPEAVDERQGYGTEAGGGVRAITSGLRVVTSSDGGIVAAVDRLPQPPQITTALPERLGGGFLFLLGTTVWRADRWLGTAQPIFTSPQSIQGIVAGLDRVYLRAQTAYLAIDGKTGRLLDLGPWPSSPFVASYAAADGWRAAAVTDLRGVVATFDAGATWRTLDLPFEPRQVITTGDNLAIGGVDGARAEAWFEVRADGSVARLAGPPRDVAARIAPMATGRPTPSYGAGGITSARPYPPATIATPPPPPKAANDDRESRADAGTKIFGKRPLAAAIEDGWPLTDGTAIIARDGALARVRLADGAMTELVHDAFPLKPARCHPVSLTRTNAAGAFGFVCGEPRGTTAIYAYEPLRGRLSEIKRFDKPRVVTTSGNGALAVRGGCAEDAEAAPIAPLPTPAKVEKSKDKSDDKAKPASGDKASKGDGEESADKTDKSDKADKSDKTDKDEKKEPAKLEVAEVHPYCVLGHDNTWREIHVRGDVGGERVVVLADGRIVVLSPPQGPTSPARLTLLDKGRASTVAIAFPKVSADVGRMLRLGLWMDGFEERRPGVVGGWIEAGGAMLGLEIALDGKATPGQFISDAGMPFVSGRYGFGWTASRRGFETTNGGMSWTNIDLPDPLLPAAKVDRRACGPVGCIANGWLRVGWGEEKRPPPPPAPPIQRSTVAMTAPQVQLSCEPIAPAPPVTVAAQAKAPKVIPSPSPPPRRFPISGPPVLGGVQGLAELTPFYSQHAPPLRDAERGMNYDVRDLVSRDASERIATLGPLAKIYVWGPKTGEWETLGKWQVKWLSPFAGWPETRASAAVLPPAALMEMTRAGAAYGYSSYGYGSYGYGSSSLFQVATGDDSAHALLFTRRAVRNDIVLYELEADRPPLELRRADGEPFAEIDGSVRAAGRWFLATAVTPGSSSPATTIWTVEAGVARELVRVPRAGITDSGRAPSAKLARRSDGRAIGLVVDGQPTPERPTSPVRWVLPIDLESGQLGEPEALGYADLAGRTLDACSDDVVGWVFDTPSSSTFKVKLPQDSSNLTQPYVRLRLTGARACIERVAGTYGGGSMDRSHPLTRPGATKTPALKPGEILVTATSTQVRYPLKCTILKEPAK